MVFYSFLIFTASLVLLVKGSDLFVDEAARVARLLGISEFVIGTTLVAVGTSFPELASSLYAAFIDHTAVAVGTIVGSNIANIGFVLGIGAVLTPIVFVSREYQKDVGILLGVSLLFYLFSLDYSITFPEAILFLLIFVVYIVSLLRRKKNDEDLLFRRFLQAYIKSPKRSFTLKNYNTILGHGFNYRFYHKLQKQGFDIAHLFKQQLLRDVYAGLFYCVLGIIGLSLGAKYLVMSSLTIASSLGIPLSVIVMTAVAIGTSLPELFVTISSARKGLGSILIGNLVGSNLANILLVGGITALVAPLQMTFPDLIFSMPFMLFMTLAFVHFVRSKWMSKVFQGVFLLLYYFIFFFFLTFFSTAGL